MPNRTRNRTTVSGMIIAFIAGILTTCAIDSYNEAANPTACRPGTVLYIPKEGKFKDYRICIPEELSDLRGLESGTVVPSR